MKLQIFAVRDRQTDQFGNPMFLIARGQAIRSFIDEVNRAEANNQLYTHPEDFDLYHIGEFDTDTAVFSCPERPIQISIGKDVKQS